MIELESPPTDPRIKKGLTDKLKNKAWRMSHLYLIRSATKEIVEYVPRAEQLRFYTDRHTRNFVPKSRKYGISTAILLDYFDDCIWAHSDNAVHAAHVDFREPDAYEKLNMARFAWEQGPQHPNPVIADIWAKLHKYNPLVVDNKGELGWQNGSRQQAGMSFMGGSPTRLHISEFGPLAAQFPDRAAKVMRGTINAASTTTIVDIETTMEGGTFGECAVIFELALGNRGKKDLSPLQWKMFFIPWFKHPDHVLPGRLPQKKRTEAYFRELELSDSVVVTGAQQAWYEDKKAEQGNKMFTQFPTVVRECLFLGVGTAYFDPDALTWQREQILPLENGIMYGDVVVQGDVKDYERRSANWVKRPKGTGWLQILEHPLPGRRYILFADCCVGKQAAGSDDTKRDTHSYGIIKDTYVDGSGNKELPQIVALCMSDNPDDKEDLSGDRCPTMEFIRRVVAMSIYWGDCCVVPEINNKDDIALRLMAAGVRNMYVQGLMGEDGAQPGTKKSEEVYGWLTDEGSRRQILEWMQMETLQERWICGFKGILHQMSVFVVNKKGRPEAAPGEHDDNVMGPAVGLFNLRHGTVFRGRDEMVRVQHQQAWVAENSDPRGL